ncbi:probable enoyl-CoA hydratase 2, mitochondrial isoform X3 [Magnolia sinica]|uniref:probable enoyl-CoA hydratase 2, mitochondrial isoform X3 n=1 Tax=Magnolia sinica TaxID=86752 RepID=UPI0026589A0B|nr:probable enoyl-CoA hydratase 2, mitochondrial isoform X3 [Magnolia sinica]
MTMKSPFKIITRSIATLSITRSGRPISSNHQTLTRIPNKISSIHRCQHQLQIFRNLLLQTASSDSVRMERLSDSDSGIVEVKLDRPEAKNAIGKDMLRGLQNAFESLSRDSSANVLMISSSVPRVFCAGADLKERRLMSPSEVQFFVNSLRSTFSFLEALCVPTVAVIEGAALGGGLEMVLSCDLRICGEDAVFSMPETGLAIIPGAGGTQRLPRVVGKAAAKELIFTGRKIDGKDAMSMGLVNYCVPAGGAYLKALQIARDINQKPQLIEEYYLHGFP